jgi:hypothetical protein
LGFVLVWLLLLTKVHLYEHETQAPNLGW